MASLPAVLVDAECCTYVCDWRLASRDANTVYWCVQKTTPVFIRESYKGSDKLKGKVAIITGRDLALYCIRPPVLHSVVVPPAAAAQYNLVAWF
jgi:hypothetical protein